MPEALGKKSLSEGKVDRFKVTCNQKKTVKVLKLPERSKEQKALLFYEGVICFEPPTCTDF